MGSLEHGAPPVSQSLTKRVPRLGPSSPRPLVHHHRPYRSKLPRFHLLERVGYSHLLCIAAFFFSVVVLSLFFLPGSTPDNHLIKKLRKNSDRGSEIADIGLDFGEGIRFEPVKLLESWEKARRDAKENLNALSRQVLRVGVRKPRLAMVFGDLVMDDIQLEMVSVAAALKEAGCEIEVFTIDNGPAGTVWKSLSVPVHNVSVTMGRHTYVDWLNFDVIFVNSLRARPILSR